MGKSYVVNEGDGAFYFQLPQRFDIDYIGADGEKQGLYP